MARSTQLKEVKDALAHGTEKLGFLTWYDIADANISPARLSDLFIKHGLDKKHFPSDIKEKNAFQKAVRMAMAEVGKSSDERRSVARLIVDGQSTIVYGIVDLDVQKVAETVEPKYADKVWLDKDKLTVHFQHGHQLSLRVRDIFNRLLDEYTSRDIARMIVQTMDRLYCVSLRAAGVVYFVPAKLEPDLLALQKVVNEIGTSNMQVYTLGSHDTNAHGVEQAARSQIQDRIEGLKQDIASLADSAATGTIRGVTVNNGIEVRKRRFKEIKLRCQILADALRIKAESLEGDLNKVGEQLDQEVAAFINGAA